MKPSSPIEADILATDSHGLPVLLVEIKGVPPVPESVLQLVDYLREMSPDIPFGMIADPHNIQVFRSDGDTPLVPVLSMKTGDVLRRYEPQYDPDRISDTYLTALTEIWLRDLAIGWSQETPPASDQVDGVGLLSRLRGGIIERGTQFVHHPLR